MAMPEPSEERPTRFTAPYTRTALEWTAVVLFAGLAASILGIAAAIVYRAWQV